MQTTTSKRKRNTKRNATPATVPADASTMPVNGSVTNAASNAATTETSNDEKPKQHDYKPSYAGPSPTVRGHARKLSPVKLDAPAPKSVTERDDTFVTDLYRAYGDKPFPRLDADAGNMRRAIGHGFIAYVSGNTDARDCKFQLTDTGCARARNRLNNA